MPSPMPRRFALLARTVEDRAAAAARDSRTVAEFLRTELAGGALLLLAAVLALVLANSPLGDTYASVRDHHIGLPALGLDLSVGHWASDGLLTLFFFVAGIELKRELVVGQLRHPADALLPVVAAAGGVVVPALLYVAVAGPRDGWAVPMATDIAFTLGVLAVAGRRLPAALRTFLLTLAIVDDLVAILVIAVLYTETVDFLALGGTVAGLALFWALHRRRVTGWYVYVPLALVIWALAYNSGVHATVAGVAMGMLLRVTTDPGEEDSPAERAEHRAHPWSAGVAVPLFALAAAGVEVSAGTLGDMAAEPVALGVVLGLVVGKFAGVFGSAWLASRLTRARLHPDLSWPDLAGGAMLAGIGFTVSLLMTELSFEEGSPLAATVKAAVLAGSLLSAVAGGLLLTLRGRHHDRRRDAAGKPGG